MGLEVTLVTDANGMPRLNPDGTQKFVVERVHSSSFFEGSGVSGTNIPNTDVSLQNSMDAFIKSDPSRALTLVEGAKNIDLGKIVEGAGKVLGVVGVLATAYQIWEIGKESKAAYDAGDNFKAAEIIAKGAAEIGTGWALGLAAAEATATFLTPLLPLGPVGVVLGAVAVAGAGLLAAWGGTTVLKHFLDADSGATSPGISIVDGWKITNAGGIEIREAIDPGQGGVDKIWKLPNADGGVLQIEQNTRTGQQTNSVWEGPTGHLELTSQTVWTPESNNVVKVQTTTFDKDSGSTTNVIEHKAVSDGSVLDTTTVSAGRTGTVRKGAKPSIQSMDPRSVSGSTPMATTFNTAMTSKATDGLPVSTRTRPLPAALGRKPTAAMGTLNSLTVSRLGTRMMAKV